LYQLLAQRGNVHISVLYLSDRGHRAAVDPGFGREVSWDIDMLSGYEHRFLKGGPRCRSGATRRGVKLARWIAAHDAIVLHGYSDPWMITAMALCRLRGVPYLLRGVSASSGCLAIGNSNHDFYRRFGGKYIVFAPYSVDNRRFARTPSLTKKELLGRWGLSSARPVIIYCGKLYGGKRPLDLVDAAKLLSHEVTTIFVGDGVMADTVRARIDPGCGVVTGFVNQSELPSYYHAADILVLPSETEKWGLVVNEAMVAGVLPIVSDRVGAAPDLVTGVGEIYPCGNVRALADALSRGIRKLDDPTTRQAVKVRASQYSLDRTAAGFELAALTVGRSNR
jgi:glycosyltransferase involved in cell wall biosynthesis